MRYMKDIQRPRAGRSHATAMEEVLHRLDALTPIGGPVPGDAVIEAERLLSTGRDVIHTEFIKFRNANRRLAGRPAFRFPSVLIALLYAYGDIKKLYRRLEEVGWPDLPGSYSAFYRAFAAVDPGIKDFMKISTEGLMNRFPFEQWIVDQTNRVWHMDCTRLKIQSARKDSRRSTPQWRLEHAWLIAVWDASKRYLLAVAVVDGQPTSEDIQGVLASAMRLRPEGPDSIVVGGVPWQIITDNGSEFIAKATTKLLAQVRAEQRPTRRYMKQLNGKAERNGASFSDMLLSGLPSRTRAPVKYNQSGTMSVQLNKSVSVNYLNRKAQELRHEWNWKRKHRMIQATPGAAYTASADPISTVGSEVLVPFFPTAERNDGIVTYSSGRAHHDNVTYLLTTYENASSEDQKLLLRHPHGDDTVLYGFFAEGQYEGRYFGTFIPASDRTEDDAVALDHYRVKTTNLAADLAAAAAVLQATYPDADPVETLRRLKGNELDDVPDFEWLNDFLVEYSEVLLRKGSAGEDAYRAAAGKTPRRRSRKSRRKVNPNQGLLFLEIDGEYLCQDNLTDAVVLAV